MGIFEHSNDEFMFKIEYKKYLYNNFNIANLSNIISNNTNYSTKPEFKNTLSTNETQNKFSKTKNKNNVLDFNQILENNLHILFVNALKIIIRQDKLNSKYIDKIKLFLNKDNKYNNKGTSTNSKEISLKNVKKLNISSVSFPNNNNISIVTSKSSFKKKVKNVNLNNQISNYDTYSEENVKNHLVEEKNILKYRLMYLISFVLKYIGIINDCYNNVFNNMDEWIIMNMDTQNNKLDEFIGYLKRALNKNFDEISMKGREFYYNEKYAKNKKLVLPIYKNLYPDSIINISKQFSKGDNFQKNLVKLQDLNYFQQYIYNINDLIIFYQAIKEYGLQTCEYFVKYEIVKELFMNYVINQKEYSYFYEDLTLPKNNIANNNNANVKSNFNQQVGNETNKKKGDINKVENKKSTEAPTEKKLYTKIEVEQKKEKDRDKSFSKAMDRFKRRYKKDNSVEVRPKKSEKINEMAKQLESVLGKANASAEINYESNISNDISHDNEKEGDMDGVLEKKPVISKKSKKQQQFQI
jgi:hypothetical protein